jgi:formate hydrogenlyase subunit 4
VFAYLLGLGRFFLMIAALDTGSSFEGMGASREAAFSALSEPVLFLALAIVFVPAQAVSFEHAWSSLPWESWGAAHPAYLATAIALFIVLLAENSRIPVDDPNTHLELTMIHEAMVLEYSGRYLALIEWAAALKLLIFFSLLANLFVPWGVATALSPGALAVAAAAFLLKLAALAVLVAVMETGVAKLRLFRVPELLSVSFVLAVLAVTSTFLLR